ncbi:hypothetical protein CNEO2_20147 [Clostridium neonatale]|nr:hypothetical protein CNEO2_20147 [Clostridium neonatale]CAI3656157.1 hypothetical protein CNEO4_80136 [Clostridium neonatale]
MPSHGFYEVIRSCNLTLYYKNKNPQIINSLINYLKLIPLSFNTSVISSIRYSLHKVGITS